LYSKEFHLAYLLHEFIDKTLRKLQQDNGRPAKAGKKTRKWGRTAKSCSLQTLQVADQKEA